MITTCRLPTVLIAAVLLSYFCGDTTAVQLSLPARKILAPNSFRPESLWFGDEVSLDGDYLGIGAPISGTGVGRGFVLKRSGKSWEYVLAAPGSAAEVFGGDADSPPRALISDGRLMEEQGDIWVEVAKLPGDGALDGDTVVSLSGRNAFVSELQDGLWNPTATLAATVPDRFGLDGLFGQSIAVRSDEIFVAAPAQDIGALTNSGVVFNYKKSGGSWADAEPIVPDAPVFRGGFGYDIAYDGETLLVGRPAGGPAADGPFQGAAYVYEEQDGAWRQTGLLQASDGFLDDGFGLRVALSGDFAAVTSLNISDEGRVYLFRREGADWNELGWLATGQPANDDQYGESISLSGGTLAVGARLDDELGNDVGAVYVYQLPEPSGLALFAHGVMAVPLRRLRPKGACRRPGNQPSA